MEVTRRCKLHYGIPILRAADPEFCEFYDDAVKDRLEYADKLLLMDHMGVTSEFTRKQASEYIDSIIADYAYHGHQIADPRQ